LAPGGRTVRGGQPVRGHAPARVGRPDERIRQRQRPGGRRGLRRVPRGRGTGGVRVRGAAAAAGRPPGRGGRGRGPPPRRGGGAGAIAGEKDRDTWTSLLATPLGTHEILVGKCYGCVFGQRDAMYLLAAVWAVGVLTMSVNPFAVALAAGALAIYLVAFAWLGIACSVTARNTRTAIARAVPL